jgi:hypothetical protein
MAGNGVKFLPTKTIKYFTLLYRVLKQGKGKAVSTVTGLEWPRRFQEVKVPRFHDNSTGWW